MPKPSWELIKVSMLKNCLFWDDYLVAYRQFRCSEEGEEANSCYQSSNLLKRNQVPHVYEIRRSKCQSLLTAEFFYAVSKGRSVILFYICNFRNAAILITGKQLQQQQNSQLLPKCGMAFCKTKSSNFHFCAQENTQNDRRSWMEKSIVRMMIFFL